MYLVLYFTKGTKSICDLPYGSSMYFVIYVKTFELLLLSSKQEQKNLSMLSPYLLIATE